MGRAMAVALAAAGSDVVVVAREPEEVTRGRSRPHEPVDPVAQEITKLGRRALGITADVRDRDEVARMVQEVQSAFGRIDVLVNVVGGSWGETFRAGPLMELSENDLLECYRVNVVTGFLCSTAVYPIMKQQGRGSIINIASVAGRGPSPNSAAYGAAKAAVINMSQTMAIEWAPEVRVNAIAIGGVETPHRPRWVELSSRGENPDVSALGRLGTPEEHAGTVAWLASDASSYITGIVVDAHGGRRR